MGFGVQGLGFKAYCGIQVEGGMLKLNNLKVASLAGLWILGVSKECEAGLKQGTCKGSSRDYGGDLGLT